MACGTWRKATLPPRKPAGRKMPQTAFLFPGLSPSLPGSPPFLRESSPGRPDHGQPDPTTESVGEGLCECLVPGGSPRPWSSPLQCQKPYPRRGQRAARGVVRPGRIRVGALASPAAVSSGGRRKTDGTRLPLFLGILRLFCRLFVPGVQIPFSFPRPSSRAVMVSVSGPRWAF